MVKRKLQNSVSRVIREIVTDSNSSFLNKKFKVSDLENVRKNLEKAFKEDKKRALDRCSSSSSSCSSEEGSPEKRRRRGSAKCLHDCKANMRRKCSRKTNVQKKKALSQKTVLRTRYKNPSYCGSCESVELTKNNSQRLLSHINLPSSTDLRCSKDETQEQRRKSFCLIQPMFDLSSKKKEFSELDGVKFVSQRDVDGSATEISFQSTLLMCVRKTSASLDVRSQRSKNDSRNLRIVETGQLNDILSEVSAGSRGLYRCNSSNLLRMAVHNNCSKSRSNLLRLKSSQNFTDLSFQRKISHQNVHKSASSNSHSCKDLRDILLPQSIQGSTVNSFLNSKSLLGNSQNNINGDHHFDSVPSDVQFANRMLPSVPLSRSQISRLHLTRYPGTMRTSRNLESRVHHPSSHNTIVVQAIVHRDGDLM